MDAAVRVNPQWLPNVFLAGEAWSSQQAWIEGALETAEHAVHAFLIPYVPHSPRNSHPWMIVDGWVVDVEPWIDSHPGGANAIRAHLREDVTELMHHIGHSDTAWATAHALKVFPVIS